MKRVSTLALALGLVGLIVACGERPQIAASKGERKSDAKGFAGADPGYSVPGWKAGDEASWQQQLKQRAQSQNEHVRVGAQKSGS